MADQNNVNQNNVDRNMINGPIANGVTANQADGSLLRCRGCHGNRFFRSVEALIRHVMRRHVEVLQPEEAAHIMADIESESEEEDDDDLHMDLQPQLIVGLAAQGAALPPLNIPAQDQAGAEAPAPVVAVPEENGHVENHGPVPGPPDEGNQAPRENGPAGNHGPAD